CWFCSSCSPPTASSGCSGNSRGANEPKPRNQGRTTFSRNPTSPLPPTGSGVAPPLSGGRPVSGPLLSVKGVSKHFGGFTALSEVSIAIAPGERFGLIGPNGSGKTTLINCISGSLRNEGGTIEFQGEEISRLPAYRRTRKGIARSFQIPRPFHSMSVLENLLV